MENRRRECINRDVNAVNNMKKLVKYYIGHKSRPINYTRVTATNPQVLSTPVSNDSMPAKVRLHPTKTINKKVLIKVPDQNTPDKLSNVKSIHQKNDKKLIKQEQLVNNPNKKIRIKKSKIEITI